MGTDPPKADEHAAVPKLIDQALRDQRADQYEPSESLELLQRRADREVLDTAMRLLASELADERMLGVRILRDLGVTGPDQERAYWQQSLPAFLALMAKEDEVDVMRWLVPGIGFLRRPEALPALVEMADYPDPDVRESLADAITYSINDHSRPEAEAIAVLVRLAADAEPDVRYSAVFELAYWAPDLPVVRDCLLVATEDADTQIAAYARGGLGRLDGKSLEECPDRELVDY